MATNNILDLPRDQFLASLNELAAQGVNTDELMRQYRRANSPFSGLFDWAINSERDIANEGRTTAGAGLFSKEAGTTGMDALASTRIEPANFIAGLLSGGAQAVDAPAAAAQGLLPAADMPMEALGTAGMAMTGGAAAPRPAGSVGMGGRVASGSNVQKSVRGMIGDQMDLTMDLVSPEGQRLGRVDYSVYDGQPAIQMIEVAPEFRRQGVATELLRNLQREYPDQEIDWGSLTSEGSQLYNNTRFVDVDQTGGAAQSLPALEAKVRSAEADYLATFRDDFKGDPSPIRDLFYSLEDELDAAREAAALPPKRLIELSANRDATTGAIASAASGGGFDEYLRRVNPQGYRVDANDRPNLMMGDMYGMLPRNARKVGERDGVSFYQAPDGASYATAFNPDVGEMDVVGYAMPRGDMTDLAVVNEMQGRGIGSELQYLMRSQDPYALTGGLTEAGEASLRRTYNRLRDEGIVSANRDATTGAIALPAARNEAERMARQILEMRAAGRAGEVTDAMMAQADPQYMFNNTPLPMDEASRMARAGEAGFTTGRDRQDVMRELRGLDNPQLVHYTNRDFNEFRIPERQNRKAIWATPDPSVNLATKDNFQNFSDEGVVGIPVMGRMTKRVSPYDFRMAGDPMTPGFPRNVTAEDVAKANSVGADYAEAGLEYAIFDPTNIRSRFARFDPEFSHLANLNAANASPLAGILAMPNEEERNRQLGMLFGGYR